MNESPVVVGIDEQSAQPIDVQSWADLALDVLNHERVGGSAELNLTFVDREEMARMNVEHMAGSGPTDVLSFPLDDAFESSSDEQIRLLGDVVICPEVVFDQAATSFDEELALMVVHGVLHILGMDHAEVDDEVAMKAAEQRHLDRWRCR